MNRVARFLSSKMSVATLSLAAMLLLGRTSYACGTLASGGSLTQGESLTSCDGTLMLTLQYDGNLVLTQNGIGALWASGTNGSNPATSLDMQLDGNLVLYNAAHVPFTQQTCYDDLPIENEQYGAPRCLPSGTWQDPGAYVTLQSDGNVVVSSSSGHALWATATSATATPPYMLQGSSNYVIGNQTSCVELTDVEIVIEITEDLVGDPNATHPGFAFQINASSPNSSTAFVTQQFIFGVDPPNPGYPVTIGGGAINDWTLADIQRKVSWGPIAVPLATLATPYTIPKGYVLTLVMGTTNGVVTSANWTVMDQYGTSHSTTDILSEAVPPPPAGTLAPINAFQVDIVGTGDTYSASFLSGAGTITYYVAQSVSALSSIPSCAFGGTTAEQSNMTYGGLPRDPDTTMVQTFQL